MDPAIVLFGLGIGVLVGMTGMGGGSLMTPLLILVFHISPTTAIGTDIFYAAESPSAYDLKIDEDRLNELVYAVLGGTLLMVGIVQLARSLILRKLIDERDRFEVERRHKIAAVVIGATTGFVIGVTSAGSGTASPRNQ